MGLDPKTRKGVDLKQFFAGTTVGLTAKFVTPDRDTCTANLAEQLNYPLKSLQRTKNFAVESSMAPGHESTQRPWRTS